MNLDDTTTIDGNYRYLTSAQYLVAFCAGCLSSGLSLLGSGTIVYLVLKQSRLHETIYHRIVFGLSCMDLVVTVAVILQPFLLPSYTRLPFASGQIATCDGVAFLLHYYLGSYIYSCELSLYFLFMIRYNISEVALAKTFEPFIHIVPVLVPTLFGIYGLTTQQFNPDPVFAFCDISVYPSNCLDVDSIECERGLSYAALRIFLNSVVLLAVLIGTVSTWLVYWTVQQRIKRSRRHSFVVASYATNIDNPQQLKRIRSVAWQAFWYTAAYLNAVLIFFFLPFAVQLDGTGRVQNTTGLFALVTLLYFLFPLQGFLNCLVYLRPVLVRWKERSDDTTWLWALKKTLSGTPFPTTRAGSMVLMTSTRRPVHTPSEKVDTPSEKVDVNETTEQKSDGDDSLPATADAPIDAP